MNRKSLVVYFLMMLIHFVVNMNAHADKTLYDFRTATNTVGWQIVNDDVMGGVSNSRFEVNQGVALFHGEVSLENNGGFASVRSYPKQYELVGCNAFIVRVRGDGRTYKFTARTQSSFDSVLYQKVFKTQKGAWQEHVFPVTAFVPTFRGRVLTTEPALEAAKVISVGFLISDQQEGPFRLEIDWIKAAGVTPETHT